MTLADSLNGLGLQGLSTPTAPPPTVLELARGFVKKWQPRLRLEDWDVWVEIGEVANENWAASSDKEWRMRRAHITFPANFLERVHERGEVLPGETDAQLVEQTVVHELLHILEEPLGSRVNDEIVWLVGDRDSGTIVGADLRGGWRDYREWWINHVVRALLEAYAGR